MSAKHLFEHLSPEVMKEMMRLAGQNWRGTGYCLPDLQLAAGQPDLAERSLRQGKYDEANSLYLRAIESGEKT
ncbi:unnamed protein product, partial [Ectocarpus sp. 12 AP-2014]